MALLRLELVEKRLDGPNCYDCLVEATTDFTGDDVLKNNCGDGSMAFCLANEGIYVKKSTGWEAATT